MSFTNEDLIKIYNDYVKGIFKYFYIRTGNTEISQDLTSTTFHKLLENSEKYDSNKGNISQYLYRIARNVFIDYLRKHKDINISDNIEELEGCNKEEDKSVVIDRNTRLLVQCITDLSDSEQHLLHLRYTQELSYEEISSQLNMPIDTVGVKLHRCIDKLKKIIKRKGFKNSFDI